MEAPRFFIPSLFLSSTAAAGDGGRGPFFQNSGRKEGGGKLDKLSRDTPRSAWTFFSPTPWAHAPPAIVALGDGRESPAGAAAASANDGPTFATGRDGAAILAPC